MNDNARLAFMSSSYEEYSRMYDFYYGVEKKKEEKPMKRFIKIRFADGLERTFNMAALTINDMISIRADGGVVIDYING